MEKEENTNVAKYEKPDFELDLDKLPKIDKHNWTERGLYVTCDGCGTHTPHRHVLKGNKAN